MMKYLLIHGHLIVDNQREYLDGAILVDGETILDVYPQSNKVDEIIDAETIDLNGAIVMPGFFDTHTHGNSDLSFDDADKDELDIISLNYAKKGTTSFLASLSSECIYCNLKNRINIFNNYESKGSRFMGLHLEGPFLNKEYCAVLNPNTFVEPNIEFMNDVLDATNIIKQMTIAYELYGAKQVGELLHKHNVKVMVGHSDALYEDLDDNVDGITHLFNAMAGFHHRNNTLVNCAFMNKWYSELIADGILVYKDALRIATTLIDKDKIMLITDLSKASLIDEIKILHSIGIKYTDLLAYSSLNAYKFYNLDKKFGSLQKGKYADIVIMDDDLNIKSVYAKGKFIV